MMADDEDSAPIKPIHGKLVTKIESKELYEECLTREARHKKWLESEIQRLLMKDRYCNYPKKWNVEDE